MSDVFSDILLNFQGSANSLSTIYDQTTGFTNADAGDSREDVVLEFLKKHRALQFEIRKGGFIFDSLGNKSNQIDLICISNSALQFRATSGEYANTYTNIEGCIGAISIKSKLTTEEFIESVENLASVPIHSELINTNNSLLNFDELKKQIPVRIIFAYTGISYSLLKEKLDEVIKKNTISIERLPDLIVVNNEYLVKKVTPGTLTLPEGKQIPVGKSYTGYSKTHTKYMGARGLLTMLTMIHNSSRIVKYADYEFNSYLDKIKKADDTFQISNED